MNPPLTAALTRLAKWRAVFASWQLGTRPDTDPECQAVRDHREATILMRVELSTLARLLIDKGVFTCAEWQAQLETEATELEAAFEQHFPGFRATASGMSIDPSIAKDTMAGWRR